MIEKTVITKLLQSVTEVYSKVRQILQSVSGITKCDRHYYKVPQVLQSATVFTKRDAAMDNWEKKGHIKTSRISRVVELAVMWEIWKYLTHSKSS